MHINWKVLIKTGFIQMLQKDLPIIPTYLPESTFLE